MNIEQLRRSRRVWAGGAVLLCLLAALGVALTRTRDGSGEATQDALTYTVKRGPLTISVSESGTIQPRDQVIIKSKVQGIATILSLIPEGTIVKEGDLLVELDASELVDRTFDQEIKVQNAEAAYIQAREDLEITKSQAQSDVDAASLAHDLAQQDLKKYVEGEYPQQLKEAKASITLAEEDLNRATDKLKWSKILYDEKYIAQTELQADELSVRKAQLELEVARGKLELLEKYTNRRELLQLNSDVTQAAAKLDREKRKATASTVQAEAALNAKESEFKRQKEKLKELKEQIEYTKIRAPAAGQVVYASSMGGGRSHRPEEPLAEGKQVRELEDLIYLPATDRMMAITKIHESNLNKISVGMPAVVTLDALPGTVLKGSVSRIAPLANPNSFWSNPDLKVYDTNILIEDDCKDLRSGMNCNVEIVVERFPSALYVPIQCVVRVGGRPVVYAVNKDGLVEDRPVETGLDNNRMIHITGGLTEGERVLMAPPLAQADTVSNVDRGMSRSDDGDGKDGGNTTAPPPGPRHGEQTPGSGDDSPAPRKHPQGDAAQPPRHAPGKRPGSPSGGRNATGDRNTQRERGDGNKDE